MFILTDKARLQRTVCRIRGTKTSRTTHLKKTVALLQNSRLSRYTET